MKRSLGVRYADQRGLLSGMKERKRLSYLSSGMTEDKKGHGYLPYMQSYYISALRLNQMRCVI